VKNATIRIVASRVRRVRQKGRSDNWQWLHSSNSILSIVGPTLLMRSIFAVIWDPFRPLYDPFTEMHDLLSPACHPSERLASRVAAPDSHLRVQKTFSAGLGTDPFRPVPVYSVASVEDQGRVLVLA